MRRHNDLVEDSDQEKNQHRIIVGGQESLFGNVCPYKGKRPTWLGRCSNEQEKRSTTTLAGWIRYLTKLPPSTNYVSLGKKPMSRKRFNPKGSIANEVKCYNCNKMGHISKNCSAPRHKPIHAINEESKSEDDPIATPEPHINAIRDAQDLDFW